MRAQQTAAEQGAGANALRRVGRVVLLTVLLLVSLEFALQVRSHMRNGQSVFNLLTNETRYVVDPASGIKTLRPDSSLVGSTITLDTNGFGLRSPDIALEREPRSFRMAVVGASAVMGEMAASNAATFSYKLERSLRERFPAKRIDVINAGISGHRIADQRRMIESIVLAHDPDLIVMYSGFNDFADYCKRDSAGSARQGLPALKMPAWVLSFEAIKRHTRFLRPAVQSAQILSPEEVDVRPFRTELQQIAAVASASGVGLVMLTNAKAYGRSQPPATQQRLAAEQLGFMPCFDLAGMLDLYDLHNDAIRQAGEQHGFRVLDLAAMLPEGPQYFVDATHFNPAGEALVAQHLHDYLIDNDLVVFRE